MQIRELDPDHGYWLTWLILQTLEVSLVLPLERRDGEESEATECYVAAAIKVSRWHPGRLLAPVIKIKIIFPVCKLLQTVVCMFECLLVSVNKCDAELSGLILRPTDFKPNEMWSFRLPNQIWLTGWEANGKQVFLHLSQETTLKITNLWTSSAKLCSQFVFRCNDAADEDLISWFWLFHTCGLLPSFRLNLEDGRNAFRSINCLKWTGNICSVPLVSSQLARRPWHLCAKAKTAPSLKSRRVTPPGPSLPTRSFYGTIIAPTSFASINRNAELLNPDGDRSALLKVSGIFQRCSFPRLLNGLIIWSKGIITLVSLCSSSFCVQAGMSKMVSVQECCG